MAPEQAGGRRGGRGGRPLRARRSSSTRRSAASTRCAAAAPRRPPGASARGCPRCGRLRRDLPLELCRALDRAVLARPEQRGTLADAARGARRRPARWPTTSAGRSPAARSRACAGPAPRAAGRARARRASPAGAARARRAWPRARAGAGSTPGRAAFDGRARRGRPPPRRWPCCCAPRLGWIAMAVRAGGVGRRRRRRSSSPWRRCRPSCSCAAPGRCGRLPARRAAARRWPAWPARGRRWPRQAARPWQRAALGALGGWWLALAEVLTGDRLAARRPARQPRSTPSTSTRC